MDISRDDVLGAALKLSEADRLIVATQLLATLPDDPAEHPLDDSELLAELDRRANDLEGAIPAADIWKQD